MQQAYPIPEDSNWKENVYQWVSEAGILNEDVERLVTHCVAAVPRCHFVDEKYRALASQDVDIPLAHGQWLTRPSLLIRILGLVNFRRRMRILELGFGSGYLCAVMAAGGCQIFGVETVGVFAQNSRKQLDTLGHHGVVVRRGEGRKGWPEVGPFEAIITSYAVSDERDLPLSQLAIGGVLVAPLVVDGAHRLVLWTRGEEGLRRVVFEEVEVQ
jgi:protein-L-isoaspartate(D-aspartate) O-methyltransferase